MVIFSQAKRHQGRPYGYQTEGDVGGGEKPRINGARVLHLASESEPEACRRLLAEHYPGAAPCVFTCNI